MNSGIRRGIVGIVVLVVLGIYFVNRRPEERTASSPPRTTIETETTTDDTVALSRRRPQIPQGNPTDLQSTSLPRMLELGSKGCRPCDMMAPILVELGKEYEGKLSVEFYDVRKDPAPARQYGIRVIPTQIFLDAQGHEVFRHEGYFPKEQILTILAQMGVAK